MYMYCVTPYPRCAPNEDARTIREIPAAPDNAQTNQRNQKDDILKVFFIDIVGNFCVPWSFFSPGILMNRTNDVPKSMAMAAAKLDVNSQPFDTRSHVKTGDITAAEPPKVKLKIPIVNPLFFGNIF